MNNSPIGIFDSGVGGLTVVKEVINALPNESIVYFGDTARVPYGSKSKETVTRFSRQMVNFLLSKGVKAIVAACNTVCSNSLDVLTKEFNIPIIDVLTPGVNSCLAATENNVVGVIGTEATIRSGAYERLLKQKRPEITVYSKACPLFVPLVEEGWTHNSVARMTTQIYLQELIDKNVDCILLGCTHYPLLYNCIKEFVGNVKIINSAASVALALADFLTKNNLLTSQKPEQKPQYSFFVSDNTLKFSKTCNIVLSESFAANKVDIEKI